MLSNAYFLEKFRFDTAENEPAKNLQNFAKNAKLCPRVVQRRRRQKKADLAETGQLSDLFHAGGVRDLQIEITRGLLPEGSLTDLGIYLWAPPGYEITFAFACA